MDDLAKLKALHKPIKRIGWNEKWLGHAHLASERSHDARTRCGCILVRDNQIISEGYNGHLRGIQDDVVPNMTGNDDEVLSKYSYMIHAELNSIINAARNGSSTLGCSAYITTTPCPQCYQELWQAGIKEIFIPEAAQIPICLQKPSYKRQMNILKKLTNNCLPITPVPYTIRIVV